MITKIAGSKISNQKTNNKSQISMGNTEVKLLKEIAQDTADVLELNNTKNAIKETLLNEQMFGFKNPFSTKVVKEIFYKRENGELAGIAKERFYKNGELIEEISY